MIISENQKINLLPIELEDIEIIRKWRNSQNIQKYLREYRLFSRKQKENWYYSMIEDNKFEMFIVKDNKSNESLGVCGLTYIDWINRHADVHVYMGKEDVWVDNDICPTILKTILEYGFNTLNLNKLWAEIYEIDIKKKQLFKDKGFNVDACLREHYYYKGKYYSSFILSLLRRDYE